MGCEVILEFYQEVRVFELRALLWRLLFEVVLRFDDDCGQEMGRCAVCFARVICLLLHLFPHLLLCCLHLPLSVFPQDMRKFPLRLRRVTDFLLRRVIAV